MNLVEIYEMQSNVLFISCQAAASSTALLFLTPRRCSAPRTIPSSLCGHLVCIPDRDTAPTKVGSKPGTPWSLFLWSSVCNLVLPFTDWHAVINSPVTGMFHPTVGCPAPPFQLFWAGCWSHWDHSSTDKYPEQSEQPFEGIFFYWSFDHVKPLELLTT